MPLGTLQHYTTEPADIEATLRFYRDVLGMENGHRPDLGFPGYWLYSGGVAVVHLLGKREVKAGFRARSPEDTFDDTGRFDHIAFSATDIDEMRQRIASSNIAFREVVLPDAKLIQLLLRDPDGLEVELNFPL